MQKRKPKKIKKAKLWGLEVRTFNKAAQQYMDVDYVNKLDDDEKEWLSQFNNEYYGNTLKLEDWRQNLHYKDQKKSIFDATNARNRDIYNKRYKYNEYDSGIAIPSEYHEYCNPEDSYLELIDKNDKMIKFIADAKASGLTEKEALELTRKVFDIE